ncbi:hypothetical protein, partial [Leptospira weilii]|uniref:hypothetical protein n=1 Tax=Leptospira weilii TaxID=28184 RepID=UPI000B0F84EF
MPEFPLFLGGRENKLYFALYGSRNRVGGGKTRKVFLYQKIILLASKKSHSCRNTCVLLYVKFYPLKS